MPGDPVLIEKGNGVADRHSSSGRFGGSVIGLGKRAQTVAEPTAFHQADNGTGVEVEDGGAALAQRNWMTQQKNFGRGGRLLQLRGLVGENLAGRAIFHRSLEAFGVLKARGMQ